MKLERINVTQSFLPPIEEYNAYVAKIFDNVWLTNNGPMVVELEKKLKEYTDNPNICFLGNGTIALQIAIKALDLKGEIITTPFSYCATTTAILWENLEPVFVDINPSDLNINADLIENAITERTSAILATHVYGNPCEVEKIEAIAKKYNLKVIYDAAHAFGVQYKGKALLNYGDISTCSFHSTKVFHTIEGGSISCNDTELFENIKKLRSFGHVLDEYFVAGVNGKNSEFHAAMGLANLPYLSKIISDRKDIFRLYDSKLNWNKLFKPTEINQDTLYNFAYYPIILENEHVLLKIMEKLALKNIFPRRYFYPTLNKLRYVKNQQSCPVSEDISLRVLALPLFPGLKTEIIEHICEVINEKINE